MIRVKVFIMKTTSSHRQAPTVKIASLFGPSTGNIKIVLKPDFESFVVWLQEGVR